jgi:hypothetical protein
MSGCKHGPEGDCGRKTVVRDMCMTHYRRWRAGKPLDTPVRGYRRYEEGPDGDCFPVTTRPVKPQREVFARERPLLRELGLR